jgi:hypothetical protein
VNTCVRRVLSNAPGSAARARHGHGARVHRPNAPCRAARAARGALRVPSPPVCFRLARSRGSCRRRRGVRSTLRGAEARPAPDGMARVPRQRARTAWVARNHPQHRGPVLVLRKQDAAREQANANGNHAHAAKRTRQMVLPPVGRACVRACVCVYSCACRSRQPEVLPPPAKPYDVLTCLNILKFLNITVASQCVTFVALPIVLWKRAEGCGRGPRASVCVCVCVCVCLYVNECVFVCECVCV